MPTMMMIKMTPPPTAPPIMATRLEGVDDTDGLFEEPEGKVAPGLGHAGEGGATAPKEFGRTTR